MQTPIAAAVQRGRAFFRDRRKKQTRGATDPILVIAAISVSLVLLVGGSFAVSGMITNGQDSNAKGDLDKVATAETAFSSVNEGYAAYDSSGNSNYRLLERGGSGVGVGFHPTQGGRVVVDISDHGWVAASLSQSGKVFLRSSESSAIEQSTAQTYGAAGLRPGSFYTNRAPGELDLPTGITSGNVTDTVDDLLGRTIVDFTRGGDRPEQLPGWTGGFDLKAGDPALNAGPAAKSRPKADVAVTGQFLAWSFDGSGSSDKFGKIADYAWDFGDGKTSTSKSPDHVYADAGKYAVTLKVTDDQGNTSSTSQTVTAVKGVKPVAAISATGPFLKWTFGGASSTTSMGSITDYAWDFGDGSKDSGAVANHTYDTAGAYTVKLTVTNDQGGKDTATFAVQARQDNPPTAAFTSAATDLNVALDGSASSDPDAGDHIVSYAWDFGDGKTATNSTASVQHDYASGGTYTVKLTVKDTSGASDTVSHSVTVVAPIQKATIGTPVDDLSYISNGGSSYAISTAQSHSGGKSLLFKSNFGAAAQARFIWTGATPPGGTYKVTFWYYMPTTPATSARMGILPQGTSQWQYVTNTVGGKWTQVSFTTSNITSFYFGMESWGTGNSTDLYIDDIYVAQQ